MDNSKLKALAEAAAGVDRVGCLDDVLALNAFTRTASPAAILALIAENDRMHAQVRTLQSDANSWQSGYDKGRADGGRYIRAECEALRKDGPRLAFLMQDIDGFMSGSLDRYDHTASVMAERENMAEPTPADELEGFRRCIDAAMTKEGQANG